MALQSRAAGINSNPLADLRIIKHFFLDFENDHKTKCAVCITRIKKNFTSLVCIKLRF